MDVAELARIVLTLLAMVGVGVLLRAAGVLSADDARPVHAIIIYVGLPALIFQAVHPATLEPELGIIAVVAWVVFGITATVAWALARALRLPRRVAGGFILVASLGNTGYIGYPVSRALLGDEGLVRAIFYDSFGTVGVLLVVGLLIAQRYGDRVGQHISVVREILRFPAVLALFAALVLKPVPIPEMVSSGLDSLASLVVPLIMLSVGLSLEVRRVAERPLALGVLGAVRLLLAPLVAVAVAGVLLDDPAAVRLVALEAGMPAMMLSIVVGARFGLDTEFLASAVVLTTVASVITIPLVQLIAG
ncbi:MAG: AEC family transporter [Anaerosomatales bacterium]|nr:AEC family transporter [Anaerosomatales bacterium]MDT8435019.1 AEC family transporter [Anaerosomatales bacterium]